MSTLTAHITVADAHNNIAAAQQRVADALRKELLAQTAAEFNEASRNLHQAADDHHHWKIVLRSLTR